MIRDLFTRAEFTDLSGIRHQTTYQLEKKNIISPTNGQYTFNQIIFGRFLEQSRKAFKAKTIKFADRFGSRAQHEIDWDDVELVFLTGDGAGIVTGRDLPSGLEGVVDEWLLPVEREAFCLQSNAPGVKEFFLEHFRFRLMRNDPVVIALLGRIRQRLREEIECRGLEPKLSKSANIKPGKLLLSTHR